MRRMLPAAALCLAACSTVIHDWHPRAEDPSWRRTPGFVSVGASWSCARLHDGGPQCWGRRANSRWINAPSFAGIDPEPREFVTNGERVCVGDVDDNLICDDGELRFADVWHYDTRGAWVCAAWRCGGVSCSDGGAITPILDLDEYVDEVYLREDGVGLAVVHDRVFAWDPHAEQALRARVIPSLDPWSAYVLSRTCSDSSIEACAEHPVSAANVLQTLHNVDLERSYGCGLDDEGRVRCAWYGKPGERAHAARFFDLDKNAVEHGALLTIGDFRAQSVDVGDGHACAIDEHGGVRCWGRNEACQAESPSFCGAVSITPFREYGGEDIRLSIPTRDVAAQETKVYYSNIGAIAELELTVTDVQFERLGAGETIEVDAQFSWIAAGVEHRHPERLPFEIECIPTVPSVAESCV